ncbi:MAG: trypsin-like peptidase domain-containing protein [Deltaproteobacteria bacterium]|nr:trypsin-like peptidase domain-containing protein [Deltaproteobacteria bacterium]
MEHWIDAVVLLVTGPSICAGVALDDRTVATAYHCVATGQRPRVERRDGTRGQGRTVAMDPAHDLALVEVEGLALSWLPPRDDLPLPGERVYAIGHPYASAATGKLEGTLSWSVSEGIVSAVGETMIQTDAALNPGNSGGPLLDTEGRIVGIVSRKLAADNLSFATRVDRLQALRAEPGKPPLGGTWDGAVAMSPRAAGNFALAGEVSVALRDRAWARAQAGASLGEEDPEPHSRVTAGLRQRLGSGSLSTAIDVGAGLDGETVGPVVTGRVEVAGVGLGVAWFPAAEELAIGLELSAQVGLLHGVW